MGYLCAMYQALTHAAELPRTIIAKRIQLPRVDSHLNFAKWSNGYFYRIWRRLGPGSIPTQHAIILDVFPNFSNIGLELIAAAISRKSEPTK